MTFVIYRGNGHNGRYLLPGTRHKEFSSETLVGAIEVFFLEVFADMPSRWTLREADLSAGRRGRIILRWNSLLETRYFPWKFYLSTYRPPENPRRYKKGEWFRPSGRQDITTDPAEAVILMVAQIKALPAAQLRLHDNGSYMAEYFGDGTIIKRQMPAGIEPKPPRVEEAIVSQRTRCSCSFPHPPHDFCDGNPDGVPEGKDEPDRWTLVYDNSDTGRGNWYDLNYNGEKFARVDDEVDATALAEFLNCMQYKPGMTSCVTKAK